MASAPLRQFRITKITTDLSGFEFALFRFLPDSSRLAMRCRPQIKAEGEDKNVFELAEKSPALQLRSHDLAIMGNILHRKTKKANLLNCCELWYDSDGLLLLKGELKEATTQKFGSVTGPISCQFDEIAQVRLKHFIDMVVTRDLGFLV